MPAPIDYTGQKIGRLTFISSFKNGKKTIWNLECDCGSKLTHRADYISIMKTLGRHFECKECLHKRRCPIYLNAKYGRWTVIKQTKDVRGKLAWLCLCECGSKRIRTTSELKRGKSLSCGCYARKIQSKWANATQYPPSHGMKKNDASKEKEHIYRIRAAMLIKCYNEMNETYRVFGGKGYSVCDLWRNGAEDFYYWIKSKNYKKGDALYIKEGCKEFNPDNCFLMTKSRFFKTHNALMITWKDETMSITDWSKKLGCSISCLSQRLKKYAGYELNQIMDLSWTPHRNQKYGTEHLEKQIVKLYEDGKTFKEISNDLGCEHSTITRFLKKNKITGRPAKSRFAVNLENRKEEFLTDLDHLTYQELMEKYGFKNYAGIHYYKRKWTIKNHEPESVAF